MNGTVAANLVFPALAPVYARTKAASETILRLVTGGLLVAHGSQKVVDPFGSSDLVGMLGFYPAPFWSVLLSVTEFAGGVLLVLGLLTRPAALATSIILLVTIWFHWVTVDQGFAGAEKSILWFAVLVYFVAHGGGPVSVDARLNKQI
ncbi:DoxX family protein [Aminobacter sp. MET-1]|uniref:DoxX family protein n=1 Tax=Aminobacter sp. MET-1 TaxID=2951085 RepID=UPI00226AAA57|nr:DoxX family protein [Aminobacter sp. MET-1]MCX8570752.1 DoxX family protein [Aminobacter sp. MET-1]